MGVKVIGRQFRKLGVLLTDESDAPGVGGGTTTPDAFNQIITDASSFSLILDSGNRNAIQWIAAKRHILIGTTGGEWRMSGHSSKPLTPSNYDLKQQTYRGSKNLQPIRISDALAFVNSTGRKLYKLDYNGVSEDYETPDLTVLAEHVTESGITTMGFQRNPDEITWATRLDGTLISKTYDPIQNVIAWARHPLPSGGEADSATEDSGYSTAPEYPLLQELTASEIPTAPTQPVNTAADTAVGNATELEAMTGANKYYLTNDIDLDGVTWTPITTFTGVFDGRGYTIRNLTISAAASDNQGMFGTCGTGVNIYNVTLDNFTIIGDDKVAALVAEMNAEGTITISDVTISNSTLTGGAYVAPLVAAAFDVTEGNIFGCTASSNIITCTDSSGGMLGDIDSDSNATADLNIVNCHVIGGTITFTEDVIGGFAGLIAGRTVAEGFKANVHTCTSSMELLSPLQDDGVSGIGGFVGTNDSVCWFTSCSSTGDLTITNDPGLVSMQAVGGFTGLDAGLTNFINCFSTGNISITLSDCSLQLIGGFVGKWDSAATGGQKIYRRNYATGNIILNEDGLNNWDMIGGFGGGFLTGGVSEGNTLIERCWATGDITSDNGDVPPSDTKGATGAFIGALHHTTSISTQTTTIQNCYAWGSVTVSPLSALDASYTGFIGSAYVGANSKTWILTNCYNAQTDVAIGSEYTNQITEVTYTKGMVGFESSGATITATALFWDTETSGISTDDYATGHVTSWMQTKSNFTDASWDFDTIWDMPIPVFWKNATNSNGLAANSVAVIPGDGEDEVWVSVGRVINGSLVRTIERIKPRDWGSDMEDMFFIDSGLTYDSTPTTTISGLDHLEGETVSILGDGAVLPDTTVSGGSITLAESVSVAQVGLPYTYKLKPMRMDQNTSKGTSKGSIKKITEVVISFFKTLNAEYSDGTTAYTIPWRETDAEYSSPPDLVTGDKVVVSDTGFSVEDPFQIEGNSPMPCSVRAIIPRVEQTGR